MKPPPLPKPLYICKKAHTLLAEREYVMFQAAVEEISSTLGRDGVRLFWLTLSLSLS
jgi:hypothetical protein